MFYYRKLVQFNELVIDNHDMLSMDEISVSFKQNSTEYAYGNGAYMGFDEEYNFLQPQSINTTLSLDLHKITCDDREKYISFAKTELCKHGKLWSVANGKLYWAYATCTSYGESTDKITEKLSITVDFNLYEGVWHLANKYTTFLMPFEVCSFLDCYDFKLDDNELCCEDTSRIQDDELHDASCHCHCTCVKKSYALCKHLDELQEYYKDCNDTWMIREDVNKGHQFFTKYTGEHLKNSDPCNHIIAGRVYNRGELPTNKYRIYLKGEFSNPSIEVNGNINAIKGDYCGVLIINSDNSVYYEDSDGCQTQLDLDTLEVPAIKNDDGEIIGRMNRGFLFTPRYNNVIINSGVGGVSSAYFDLEELSL